MVSARSSGRAAWPARPAADPGFWCRQVRVIAATPPLLFTDS